MKKGINAVLLAGLLVALVSGFLYSSRIQHLSGMGDLRSRIVAARMISDGHAPYYYTWYPGDTLRYYSGTYVDSPRVLAKRPANMTVAPPLLHTLRLFAENDEYAIDRGFFLVCCCCFLISIGLALYYAPPGYRIPALLLLVPFVWTDGWIYHFHVVQHYMPFGFLFVLIGVLLLRGQQVAAGLLLALLVLYRFNTLVFALPFLLLLGRYRRFLITACAGIMAYALFAWVQPFERSLWQDYFSALRLHQAGQMAGVQATHGSWYVLPLLPRPFEGADYLQLDSLMQQENFVINKESSNIKDAIEAVTGRYPPVWALQGAFLLSLSVLLGIWQLRSRRSGRRPEPYQLVAGGLLAYFLSNFFSTVATVPYHLPQWYAVGVVYAIAARKLPRVVPLLFLLGMLLNQYWFPWFKGRHLAGEMLLLASALCACLLPGPATAGSEG